MRTQLPYKIIRRLFEFSGAMAFEEVITGGNIVHREVRDPELYRPYMKTYVEVTDYYDSRNRKIKRTRRCVVVTCFPHVKRVRPPRKL